MTKSFLEKLKVIVGDQYVVTDADAMEPYLTEQRNIFRGNAIAVVKPSNTAEVSAVVSLCASSDVAVTPQGGNTGVCGGGVPQAARNGGRGIVLATERLNRIRKIDTANLTMTVEAGCILADLQDAAKVAGCFFPLSLGGEGSCRIGGNLSTNAGGINVLRYGNARDLMLGLEVVLPDGRIWSGLRALRKDNTGYALRHLFVGAEGTLGIITAADLKLFPYPHDRQTMLVAVPTPAHALQLFNQLRAATGDNLSAFELMPRIGLDIGMKNLPGSREPFDRRFEWYVLAEASSSAHATLRNTMEDALENAMNDGIALDAVVAESEEHRRALWRLREINAGGHQHQEGGLIKHDIAVPVSRVPEMITLGTATAERELPGVRVVAFGHMGDGNLHFNLVQPEGADAEEFMSQRERMNRVIHDIVHSLEGSISAEHGIGMLKMDEMKRYKDPLEIELMRTLKLALDPKGLMNPGKVIPEL